MMYISSIYLLFFSNEEIKLIWIQDASKFASSNDLGMTTCWICKRLCQGTVWSERKSIGSTVGSLLQGWNGRGDSGSWGRISRFGGEDGARGERSSRWLQGFLFWVFQWKFWSSEIKFERGLRTSPVPSAGPKKARIFINHHRSMRCPLIGSEQE